MRLVCPALRLTHCPTHSLAQGRCLGKVCTQGGGCLHSSPSPPPGSQGEPSIPWPWQPSCQVLFFDFPWRDPLSHLLPRPPPPQSGSQAGLRWHPHHGAALGRGWHHGLEDPAQPQPLPYTHGGRGDGASQKAAFGELTLNSAGLLG